MTRGEEVVVDRSLTIRVSLARAESSDAGKIVLDLRDLTFIDSSGLKSILIATRRSRADGNRLGILRGSGEVANLLELTGIDLAVNVLD